MRTADPHAPTKKRILDAAQKLMLAKGFTATSVDDICETAGATKGSFFHFFENKEDLGKVLLERFVCGKLDMFRTAPFQRSPDPLDRLLGWIDAAIMGFSDPSVPKSCLLGNFSQELAPTHPDFQSLCSQWISRSTEGFARDTTAVIRARPAAAEVDPQRLADLYFSIIQGSLILIKGKRDVSVGVENLRHFRAYIKKLFSRV